MIDKPDQTVDQIPSDNQSDGHPPATLVPRAAPRTPGTGELMASEPRGVQLREPDLEAVTSVTQRPSREMPAGTEDRGAADRLRFFGEIARGGMGAILQAHDAALGRDVAVKVLLEAHQGNAEVVRRFLEEARIAGQLQHPGVVPVYDMGRFPDRRLYFTMKLVKGQTLARLLADRQDPRQERPRFLKVFEQVCQTLAYAHARRVIHRDLKPSNIMVGAFGEVQVMDWGLAKVLTRGEPTDKNKAPPAQAEASLVRTVPGLGSDPTRPGGSPTHVGSILGTPAYMPPEQALGEVDRLDPACDVFGLGAILCEILTGQPPYVGTDATHVYRKAVRGDLAETFGRLQACGAEAELVDLARRCLAPEREGRPAHAGVLAVELTTYLESVELRLREAELAGAEARARAAEERKRRRVALALAASVLLTVVLGGGGWLWVERDREHRRAATSQQVNDALREVAQLREQARARITDLLPWARAREAGRRAEALLQSGPVDNALAERVKALLAELAAEEKDRRLVARLEEAGMAPTDLGSASFSAKPCLPLFEAAFREYGFEVGREDPRSAAGLIRSRPAAIRDGIIAGLDHWIQVAQWFPAEQVDQDWLRALVNEADPDPWRERLRDASHRKDRQALHQLAHHPDSLAQWPATLTNLAYALNEVGEEEAAVALLRRAQRRYPADFWINSDLAQKLAGSKTPQSAEALRFFSVALSLRENVFTRIHLANTLASLGRPEEATAVLQRAVELHSENHSAHAGLGSILSNQGLPDSAITSFRRAVALQADDSFANTHLVRLLVQQDRWREAAAASAKSAEARPLDEQAYVHAFLLLLADDRAGYQRFCRLQAAAAGPDPAPWVAYVQARTCAMGPEPAVDPALVVGLAQRAVASNPGTAWFLHTLGLAYYRGGKFDRAVEALHKSRDAAWHEGGAPLNAFALALAYHGLKQDRDASKELAAARELSSQLIRTPGDSGRIPAWDLYEAQLLDRECRVAIEVEPQLAALREGLVPPGGAVGRLRLAEACLFCRRFPLDAARLYAEAFTADPKLAQDVRAGHRYNAACAAGLVSRVGGAVPRIDEKESARWRRQALAWLQADLVLTIKRCESARSEERAKLREQLRHWQHDDDLAAIRDEAALATLPPEERVACRKLWAAVEAAVQQNQE